VRERFFPGIFRILRIYAKTNPADAPILTLSVTSKSLPLPQLQELAETRMAQRISQLKGVGLVSISGGQRPAVRVSGKPYFTRIFRAESRNPAQRRSGPLM